ncbi:hypothetical protein ACIP4Y_34050 [Streptomyces sp. NPDC088810]|uniref:hypothetical protein n=1 Tax=Streptomyces sp. NPDC088810 TaxID=3365904 RepID=UPI0038229938
MDILDQLPAECAQGTYATPGRHDALIRFSNGSGHLGTDARLGPVTGLALKLFDIDGPTLLEDEPDTRTCDYANINAPIFFCSTIEHYNFIQDLVTTAPTYLADGKPGFHRFLHDWVTGKGTLPPEEWAWEELRAFRTRGARARLRRQGCAANSRPRVGTGGLRAGLVSELHERPYQFNIQVQLCADLEQMPVRTSPSNGPRNCPHRSPWRSCVSRSRRYPATAT